MTLDPKITLRLKFLIRVVRKECQLLSATDVRLFEGMFEVTQLEEDPDLADGMS